LFTSQMRLITQVTYANQPQFLYTVYYSPAPNTQQEDEFTARQDQYFGAQEQRC